MDRPRFDWVLSVVRWIAWVILCLGMVTEIFTIHYTGLALAYRVITGQQLSQASEGQSEDTGQLIQFFDLGQLGLVCIIGIIVASLTVPLDYYLRAGQKKGRLFQRIGLVVGIELGVYVVATLLAHARDKLDQATAYEFLVDLHTTEGDNDGAVEAAVRLAHISGDGIVDPFDLDAIDRNRLEAAQILLVAEHRAERNPLLFRPVAIRASRRSQFFHVD